VSDRATDSWAHNSDHHVCTSPMTEMQREESKLLLDIRKDRSRGDQVNARAHAKLVVQTRKHTERLAMTKAQLSSVCMQLKEQQATVKMVGAMQTSTQLMQAMQQVVSAPSMAHTARQYAMEMQRAGLLQEMATDAIEDAVDMAGDSVDVEAEEVDAVLASVLGQTFAKTPTIANNSTLQTPAAQEQATEAPPYQGLSLSGLVEAMPSAPTGQLQQRANVQQVSALGSPVLEGAGDSPPFAAAAAGNGGGSAQGGDSTPTGGDGQVQSELEQRLARLA